MQFFDVGKENLAVAPVVVEVLTPIAVVAEAGFEELFAKFAFVVEINVGFCS